MTGFEKTLREASLARLKRELTEGERVEFLELGAAIGTKSVEDYLYMLMIFKRNEDRVNGLLDSFRGEIREKFDQIGELERKIDTTLENSIHGILHDGAHKIGRDMGERIAYSAKDVMAGVGEFHFIRGQTFVAGTVIMLSVAAYILGASFGFGSDEKTDFLSILLRLPAGNVILYSSFVYAMLWSLDHWKLLKRNVWHKALLALQVLVLIALLFYLL